MYKMFESVIIAAWKTHVFARYRREDKHFRVDGRAEKHLTILYKEALVWESIS